ncbi:MAG: hypothetical protein M1837_007228 [Sclerophora amabilis]|nr:MAG: hypothetical protein M1837_007228 [Sclerophora amabilis]
MSQKVGGVLAQAGQARNGQHEEDQSQAGSVRRARERIPAGSVQSPQPLAQASAGADQSYLIPQAGAPFLGKPYSRGHPPWQQGLASGRGRFPAPGTYPNKRGSPGAIGAGISKPAPVGQWPLAGDYPSSPSPSPRRTKHSPTGEGFGPKRGSQRPSRPPRPPRPSYVPSLVDTTSSQDYPSPPPPPSSSQSTSELGQPQPEYWEDNFERPRMGSSSAATGRTTSTPSSRPSTSSSIVSIPDFPIPASFMSRKSTTSGPPLSRRGYSSYYSQNSFVAPILEETEPHRSQASMASGHALPSSWGSGPLDYYLSTDAAGLSPDDGFEEETQEGGDDNIEEGKTREGGDDGGESMATNYDDDEERTLVRKASLGKRHKPSLTTIRNSDKIDKETAQELARLPSLQDNSSEDLSDSSKKGKSTVIGDLAAAAATLGTSTGSGPPSTKSGSISGSGTAADRKLAHLNESSSSNDSLTKPPIALTTDYPTPSPPMPRARSPLRYPTNLRISRLFGGGEKKPPSYPTRNEGDGSAPRRPPPLNLDISREAETRGSLTSLPDLIQRATRLAAVLDRGRPASSRWDSQYPDDFDEKEYSRRLPRMIDWSSRTRIDDPTGRRRSGSISDILASFPSPRPNSPRDGAGSRTNRSRSPFANSALAFGENADDQSQAGDRRRRRCCGLSRPVFFLIFLLILIVVAAAIILPIVFVVLPKQQQSPNEVLAQCETDLRCMNGGQNVAEGDTCRCVCTGGFTGDSCTIAADDGCITTDIEAGAGSIKDATLGSSIPRLLQDGPDKFNIPLDSSLLLAQFSDSNLSCSSENALVTFGGRSARVSPTKRRSSGLSDPAPRVERRQKTNEGKGVTKTVQPLPPAQTSNGIVFAGPTSTGDSDAAPRPTSTQSTLVIGEDTIDFARISVLYILQKTSLDKAVSAQEKLQSFLTREQESANTTAVDAVTVDFEQFTIDFGDGKVGGSQSDDTPTRSRGGP